ncbi:Tannase/feruloyl esterase [Leucosporidium creatinivorum]|uniref:Carboxylic ester hydrolase n=1 Tax=Leucosporidium creatinivorum TaxID=106004 RepID=A0A1Y2FZV9_9BASI|nr:Tannase/feruloyl esterase [Leucosporidium creatinivorum]
MLLLRTAIAASAAASALAAPTTNRCAELWELAPKNLADLQVYVAQEYPAIEGYSSPVPNLPAFCRFGAFIHTSNMSAVRFEIWLPTDTWNGRFAMVGNGGDAGGINYPDMWGPIKNCKLLPSALGARPDRFPFAYGFAVASTDTGHHGENYNGTFAINNPESQVDFGYRAVHLTAVYSKKIIELFYPAPQTTSYWFGCSSGGKQAVKEAQQFPEDFDGVLAGAQAADWSKLMAYLYHVNIHLNNVNATGYLNTTDYALINAEVHRQCDELDGLKDSIITDPSICKPDLSSLICSDGKKDGCLIPEQADMMNSIWANWTSVDDGSWLFPGYEPGSEGSEDFSVTGSPYAIAADYYNYQVLNNTKVVPYHADESELQRQLAIAEDTNPGGITAVSGYIEPFLKRGKLLSFVGLADRIIPARSSIWYYEHVRESLGYPEDLGDSYRLFTVPNMNHCRGGHAAWNFGGPGQRDSSQNGTATSAVFDRDHDMILALMDWVELGVAPDAFIGTKYIEDDRRLGIEFQRKLCPYPQKGAYIGGDPNSADSFECKY